MTTLISFLGKGDRVKSYRRAKYRFSSDFTRTVSYFGLALSEFLEPDKLIIAGTNSSMWDVFFSDQDLDSEELLVELMDAVENSQVTQKLLDKCTPFISEKLGAQVQCQLISQAQDKEAQIGILQSLADTIPKDEALYLDVTHGFRHLPMLSLVAARYLSHVRGIAVSEIYYGALDMTPPSKTKEELEDTPVLKLSSMLDMLDWVEALAVYDNSGDYGVFGDLLKKDGLEENKADFLHQASFHEQTGSSSIAKRKLDTVFRDIQEHAGSLGKLFAETLSERIRWRKEQTLHAREAALAEAYLKHGDYLRSSMYLEESVITQQCFKDKVDPSIRDNRERAANGNKSPKFKELSDLRNALAHGTRSSEEHQRFNTLETISNEKTLRTRLSQLFNQLKPGN